MPAVDVVPEIVRDVRTEVLRSILGAIRTKQAVAVEYQSLTSSRWRDIAPHALAFDGHRWHARAWCCEREEFRDFVLTRIKRLGKHKEARFNPDHDLVFCIIHLIPFPGASCGPASRTPRDPPGCGSNGTAGRPWRCGARCIPRSPRYRRQASRRPRS